MSPQAPAWVNVAAITGFIAFIAIITVPFVYELRRGGLEWD